MQRKQRIHLVLCLTQDIKHIKHVETSSTVGSISTLYLLRLFSNKIAHTLQFLFWVFFVLFFFLNRLSSLPGSFKMSLLFSVHDLLGTKQPESSQSQKPHKPLPTPLDNPKIRHISASYKQEWMGQCFPAWQDPKKHLERLLKHRMPASWPGDSALAGLGILGPRRYRWTWPDALWDTFHIQNWIKGLPRWLSGKESACQAGDTSSIPRSGRSPGEGNGKRLQYSCLENPMDRSLKGCM